MTGQSSILGPLHIQDEVIITEARDAGNGSSCVFSMVKVDECKTLSVTTALI